MTGSNNDITHPPLLKYSNVSLITQNGVLFNHHIIKQITSGASKIECKIPKSKKKKRKQHYKV